MTAEDRSENQAPHYPFREFTPPSDWQPIAAPRLQYGGGTFVSGNPDGDMLRVRYFRRPGFDGVVGRAWFGAGACGPPGHAHGGSVAAVLDEAMGAASWGAGLPAIAARLETDFVRPIPLGLDLDFEALVESVEGRKIRLSSELSSAGDVYARATALFVLLDSKRYPELAEEFARSVGKTLDEFLESPSWA